MSFFLVFGVAVVGLLAWGTWGVERWVRGEVARVQSSVVGLRLLREALDRLRQATDTTRRANLRLAGPGEDEGSGPG